MWVVLECTKIALTTRWNVIGTYKIRTASRRLHHPSHVWQMCMTHVCRGKPGLESDTATMGERMEAIAVPVWKQSEINGAI